MSSYWPRTTRPRCTARSKRSGRLIALASAALASAGLLAHGVLAAPPSADFTISDTTPAVNQAVTFDGSGSSDADGDITTYEWDFAYDGSFEVGGTGASVTHSYSTAGPRSVALRVRDGVANDGTEDVSAVVVKSLNVSTPNGPPNATFSVTRVGPNNGNAAHVGQQLAFDGRASSDPDGDALAYEWSFGDGGTAAGPTASHTYATRGTKTVTLTVRDNRGGTDSSEQTVFVNALPVAQANILNAQAEPGQRIDTPLVGQPFVFTGGAAPGGPGSSDPEGPLTYAWDLDGNGSFEAQGEHVAHPGYSTPGERTVRLRVTDSNGATAVDDLTFRVNSPPVPGFIHEPLTPIVNEPVQFSSTSSDPDGDTLTYSWDIDGDGTFGETTPPESGPNPAFAFPNAGNRTVTLRVTDTGGVTRQASRAVTVQLSVPNGAFSFSPDAPVPGEPVTFRSASRPSAGKQITGVEWDFDYDIATGAFTTDATGATVAHSFAGPGPKRVALKVSEGPAGGFDIETQTVVVNAVPLASFTVAPGTPLAGDTVTISSTAADPDGPLAAQEWDLDGDGGFDDANGAVVRVRFARAGVYPIALRVRDSRGAAAALTRRVTVARRPLALIPDVVIQIRGRLVGSATEVTRLLVRAPARARITVRCVAPAAGARARGCGKGITRVSRGRRIRARQVERLFAPGAKLLVTVTRRGYLGRHTTFTMRAGKEPLRRDRCIAAAGRPTRCPKT